MKHSSGGVGGARLRHLVPGVVLLAWTSLSGCGPRSGATASSRASSAAVAAALTGAPLDTGLVLTTFTVRDTFPRVDSIALGYVLRNYGPAKQLRLDPRFFEVHVYDATGKPVPVKTAEWHGSVGGASDVLLPRGGFVGQVFELACGHIGVEAVESCDRQFNITRPGRYSAWVVFAPPRPPDDGRTGQYPVLTSDTVRFVVAEPK